MKKKTFLWLKGQKHDDGDDHRGDDHRGDEVMTTEVMTTGVMR
jgi:hypothetical protein